VNPEELLNPKERLVIEGHVFIGAAGGAGIGTIPIWNSRVDKDVNLTDYIEAAFGSEDNVGLYGPMRITIERMPL